MKKAPWICHNDDCLTVNASLSQKCKMCGDDKPDAAQPVASKLCEDEGCPHAGSPHVCVPHAEVKWVPFQVLEIGRTYKTRNGCEVEIAAHSGDHFKPFKTTYGAKYTAQGRHYGRDDSALDLVSVRVDVASANGIANLCVDVRDVISQLRAYNPAADAYDGKHIHPYWADRLEQALSNIEGGVTK